MKGKGNEIKKAIQAGWIINSRQISFSHNICIKEFDMNI
jgi:hypothetical protein